MRNKEGGRFYASHLTPYTSLCSDFRFLIFDLNLNASTAQLEYAVRVTSISEETVSELLHGARALQGNDPLAAQAQLEQASKLAWHDPERLADIAITCWELGALPEVVKVLEQSLSLLESTANLITSDSQALMLTRLGAAYLRLGNMAPALRVLYDALEMSDNGYSALQLGNALRYLGEGEEAEGHLSRAFNRAKTERDGQLAIAALCAQGELMLDQQQAQSAAERFGQALGITEFSRNEAITVAPLAGLAHAQVLWGHRGKATELARRALQRAKAAGDSVGEVRTRLSLGLATEDALHLQEALQQLKTVMHRPLELRIMLTSLTLSSDSGLLEQALTLAKSLDMKPEADKLKVLSAK